MLFIMVSSVILLSNIGNMALKGFGLITQEATAVCLNGRITPK